MLSYQRAMARKLFVYDEELGELRILTGKVRGRASDAREETPAKLEERAPLPLPDVIPRFQVEEPDGVPTDFSPFPGAMDEAPVLEAPVEAPLAPEISFDTAPAPVAAPVAQPAPVVLAVKEPLAVEDELLEVFLEEAREVVVNGTTAIAALNDEPGNLSEQTTLRRAFHTLKGSSRMVGLNDFGEAAWSMEQLLNAWLAEQKPMQPVLLQLSSDALQAFDRWASDIAAGATTPWQSDAFRRSADAMRLEGAVVPLALPGEAGAVEQALPEAVAAESIQDIVPSVPEVVEAALPIQDFQSTEIAADGLLLSESNEVLLPEPVTATEAEEIDFSAFTSALSESEQPAPTPPAE
eukprot:gene318-423_t